MEILTLLCCTTLSSSRENQHKCSRGSNGELIKVAIGSIICPKDRIMHGLHMSEGIFKVELSVVLNGHEDIDPLIQPPGADTQLSLG